MKRLQEISGSLFVKPLKSLMESCFGKRKNRLQIKKTDDNI